MRIKLIDFGACSNGMAPKRAHENDAGADVYIQQDVDLPAYSTTVAPLGFGLELPDGMAGYIFPRTSMSKQGIVTELPPIDSGYRGEVHAIINNHSENAVTLKRGTRVGQLVITPVVLADFSLEDISQRGTGAFGSTGV